MEHKPPLTSFANALLNVTPHPSLRSLLNTILLLHFILVDGLCAAGSSRRVLLSRGLAGLLTGAAILSKGEQPVASIW